jgi:uncharacterized protein YciI
MGTYLVVLHRSGPQWDPSQPLEGQSGWDEHAAYMDGLVERGLIVLGGPLADEHRVVHIAEGASEDAVRAAIERDPWSGTHLHIASIDAMTVRQDGRNRS